MATFSSSQEWLRQSSLLVEARPKTTRITSRYSVKPKPERRIKKADRDATKTITDKKAKEAAGAATATTTRTTTTTGQNPRAKLVLKAVDPVSGVCLRYQTTKAAEVSRLVQMLGQLSRRQLGLQAAAAADEDVVMADAEPAAAAAEATPASAPPAAVAASSKLAASTATPQQQPPSGGGGGGKGKKKKGKR